MFSHMEVCWASKYGSTKTKEIKIKMDYHAKPKVSLPDYKIKKDSFDLKLFTVNIQFLYSNSQKHLKEVFLEQCHSNEISFIPPLIMKVRDASFVLVRCMFPLVQTWICG